MSCINFYLVWALSYACVRDFYSMRYVCHPPNWYWLADSKKWISLETTMVYPQKNVQNMRNYEMKTRNYVAKLRKIRGSAVRERKQKPGKLVSRGGSWIKYKRWWSTNLIFSVWNKVILIPLRNNQRCSKDEGILHFLWNIQRYVLFERQSDSCLVGLGREFGQSPGGRWKMCMLSSCLTNAKELKVTVY